MIIGVAQSFGTGSLSSRITYVDFSSLKQSVILSKAAAIMASVNNNYNIKACTVCAL